jgi:hypothetical protein
MGLYHALDGVTNLKYRLLYFLTPNKNNSKRKALAFSQDRSCHLANCLRLILFHCDISACTIKVYGFVVYGKLIDLVVRWCLLLSATETSPYYNHTLA